MDTIEGIIEDIIFTNEINGYTVCDIRCDKRVVTAVGYMPFVNAGESLKVTGNWVNHPDYGEQLKVELYEKKLPKTTDAIEKYLASGIIKGVGPVTAAKIVERFKEDTLDVIQFTPEALSEIKGISVNKAISIGQAFEEQRELRSVVMFLQEYGLSPSYSARIYKAFGEKTIEKIKANPYRLADEIPGIGFKIADRMAMSMGVDPSSKFRVCSGIKYVLSQCAANGHTFMPEDKLKEYASNLLDIALDDIENALISLSIDKSIYMEKRDNMTMVYLSPFYYSELNVARKLIELSSISFNGEIRGFDEALEAIEKEEDITLADMQKSAIREALLNGVLVITGGPGTGKTTIIKSIIRFLHKEGYKVALAAPTGRAAKRMSETTGFEAKTIHRMLEIGYIGEDNEQVFQRNDVNPLDADAVIIDESSMVDILLMNHLLKAIEPGTRLILVGDVNQLPSVGPGNVLKDIIASGIVKTVMLTEIFRQAQESMIIVNAHRINKGENPYLNVNDKDFFFMSRNKPQSIVQTIVELCLKRIPGTYGCDPLKQIQVLTPTRKGPVGVINLNLELQKALNPPNRKKNEKASGNFIFREGDRVMQIKNNYNLRWYKVNDENTDGTGVFNGDAGIIQEIDTEEQGLTVLFDDERVVEYDFSILDEIEPAYAVTVHKSQGSEFPVVIMPIFPGPPVLMTRNLLYTAVTRAMDLVILVGVENSLYGMVENKREMLRYSGLEDKLKMGMIYQTGKVEGGR